MVAGRDGSLSNRCCEGQRDGRAGSVAVLVDVDGDLVQRQTNAPRRGVDDPEVRLVRDPQVDVLEGHAGSLADLVGLADEDVDGELEDVWSDHLDVRIRILVRVCALLDVAGGDLRIAAAVRAPPPTPEARSL